METEDSEDSNKHQSSRASLIGQNIKQKIQRSGLNIAPEEVWLLQRKGREIVTPSWMTCLPKEVGMPSAGFPKAAEWLILYTVHMVLILIPKWHSLGRNPTNAQTKKLKTVATLTSIINCVMNHKLTEDDIKYLDKELINY